MRKLYPIHYSLLLIPLFFSACATYHQYSERVPNQSIPPAVVAAFQREFPGLVIDHVDYFPERGPAFEIKFFDALHQYHRKNFLPDGQLLDNRDNVALPTNPQPYAPQPQPQTSPPAGPYSPYTPPAPPGVPPPPPPRY